jgi:hypothetical protein
MPLILPVRPGHSCDLAEKFLVYCPGNVGQAERRPATIEGREGQEPPRIWVAGTPGGSTQFTK